MSLRMKNFCTSKLSLVLQRARHGLDERVSSQMDSAQAATLSTAPEILHRERIMESADPIMRLDDATSAAEPPSLLSPDQILQLQESMSTVRSAAVGTTSAPPESGTSPCLFIIEPLHELADPYISNCATTADIQQPATLSVPALRKVNANTNLLNGVRSRRKVTRVRPDSVVHPSISRASSMRRGEDRQSIMGKADYRVGGIKGPACLTRCDSESEKHNVEPDIDDDELSRQEFNKKVDTFISKFKRNLTMQRQESLNRLLGLY
ncbi:hypothetical protein KP509_29G008600 [Ceratopteris richardii]|uniref:Uncharacterized protein n=2 Tax=Ceratopteris richardii TaxID=49495 RepID=A0A8T2R6A9_CERRI|nr:hypothetical protein KP509_29G008600 [Ceratopteris richardii]